MKRLVMITAAVATAAFLLACPPEPIESLPPLEGTYEGSYSYEKTGQPTKTQFITWIFTTNSCLMDLDTTKQDESERQFCDIEARYSIGDGIQITVPDDDVIFPGRDSISFMNRTRKACNQGIGPFGRFQLDQSVENRVVMTRNNVADTAFQRITLFKISDEF